MGETHIQGVWANLVNLISGTSTGVANTSIGILADLTGMEAGIPSSTISSEGQNLSLNDFEILNNNAVGNNSGYYRYMKNGAALGDFSNMFFISVAGTYTFRAFKNSTTIYKNGSSIGTITTAMSSTTSSCAVGDRIEGNKPFTLNQNTYPNLIGAYAGFAGYTFATRVDRNSPMGLMVISLEASNSIQVSYTTTGGADITSLTIEHTLTNVTQYSAFTCTLDDSRNYFIYSTKPICVYKMRASLDTLPLYPMTSEPKFGWYSTNGHILTTNNATTAREASTTHREIKVLNSNGGVNTEINTTPAALSIYSLISVTTNSRGGHHFLGPGARTISDPDNGSTEFPMQLFTAESQADGSGSEMTPHVSSTAFAKFTVMPESTSKFVAFIADTPGSISRYNSDGCLHGTQAFSGSDTNLVYTTRFAAGIKGDFFSANTECFGYTDLNATQNDETVLFMGDSIDAPTCNTGGTVCREISLARSAPGTCERACGFECSTRYTDTPVGDAVAVGNFIYNNEECVCDSPAPESLFYSDKCGLRSGNCYTMNASTCEVTGISACE